MVLAWKAGVVKATEGSNPSLSAILQTAEKSPSAAFPSFPLQRRMNRYVLCCRKSGALQLIIFEPFGESSVVFKKLQAG